MAMMRKTTGSAENSFSFSLSNNFTMTQREVLKYIDLSIEVCRCIVERRKIAQSAAEIRVKYREIIAAR